MSVLSQNNRNKGKVHKDIKRFESNIFWFKAMLADLLRAVAVRIYKEPMDLQL